MRSVFLMAGLAVWAGPAAAQLTQGEALRLAFPAPDAIERRTAFLTEEQLARARALAGPDAEITSRVVTYYVGHSCGPSAPCGSSGPPSGVAYFDRHRVRTLNQVLMIVVSPAGRIARVEILEFQEPPDYRAPSRWLGLFQGRALDEDLSLSGSILPLTGASLTSRAVVRAARRVLALHQVIAPLGPAAAAPPRERP